MKSSRKAKETAVANRARPFRAVLQALIRDRVKTREQKKELAKFLDQSIAAVDSMLYYGEGGLDSWISALIHCYGLDPEAIQNLLVSKKSSPRKLKPLSESEKLWVELDQYLDDNEKFYWASLIRASMGIERDMSRKWKAAERSD